MAAFYRERMTRDLDSLSGAARSRLASASVVGTESANTEKGQGIMKDDPVDLDEHRSMAAQIATDIRRQSLHEFQAHQAALRQRQEELEKLLLAAPAETWLEAAAKAQYLIQLFAATAEAQNPRYKELIAHALDDLTKLCELEKEPS